MARRAATNRQSTAAGRGWCVGARRRDASRTGSTVAEGSLSARGGGRTSRRFWRTWAESLRPVTRLSASTATATTSPATACGRHRRSRATTRRAIGSWRSEDGGKRWRNGRPNLVSRRKAYGRACEMDGRPRWPCLSRSCGRWSQGGESSSPGAPVDPMVRRSLRARAALRVLSALEARQPRERLHHLQEVPPAREPSATVPDDLHLQSSRQGASPLLVHQERDPGACGQRAAQGQKEAGGGRVTTMPKACPTCLRPWAPRPGRLCAVCERPILRMHKWRFEGSRVMHRVCERPDAYPESPLTQEEQTALPGARTGPLHAGDDQPTPAGEPAFSRQEEV